MRRLALLILLVGTAAAQTSPESNAHQGATTMSSYPGGLGPIFEDVPDLNQHTPGLITPDANAVVHLVWDGTALVNRIGPAFTMNGTVPQVPAQWWGPPGAGPYSNLNYYSVTSGLPSSGDFSVCAVYSCPTAIQIDAYVVAVNDSALQNGWGLDIRCGRPTPGSGFYTFNAGAGAGSAPLGSGPTLGAAHVTCAGKSGAAVYIKEDNGVTVTGAASTYGTPVTPVRVVGNQSNNMLPFLGTIHEVYATTTPFNETTVAALQASVMAKINQPATVLHWTAEDWNMIRYGEQFENAAWANTGLNMGLAVDTQTAPDGTFTADYLYKATSAGSTSLVQFVGAVQPANTPLTVSIYARASVTSSQFDLGLSCGGWVAGGTGKVVSGPGIVTMAAGTLGRVTGLSQTQWTRIAVSALAPGAQACQFYLYPDTAGSSTVGAGVYVWGASMTRSTVPLPYKKPSTTGDTFVMQGVVPYSKVSPMMPNGSGAGRRGVGTFTTGIYFDAPNSTLGEWAGDWNVSVAFVPTSFAATQLLVGKPNNLTSAGWKMYVDTSGRLVCQRHNGAWTGATTTSGPVVIGSVNVGTCGLASGVLNAKLNGGATVTAASTGATTSAASFAFKVGASVDGNAGTTTKIYEVWATSTPFNEANVAAIQDAAMRNGDPTRALFPDDANTVLHLVGNSYDGTTWRAPQATMTTVGTVGYSDAFVPSPELPRDSYGPWSDTNYLSLGSGSDVLDTTGDRYGCALFTPTSLSAAGFIFIDGQPSIAGQNLKLQIGGAISYSSSVPTEKAINTGNLALSNSPNVACYWRSGNTIAAKLNGGTSTTLDATALEVSGVSYFAKLGKYESASFSFPGQIHEFIAGNGACPNNNCEAWATATQRRVLGMLTAQGQTVAVTRTTPETYEIPGTGQTLWTAPAGTPAISADGIGIFRATTNYALQSEASCVGNLVQAPWALTGVPVPTCTTDTGVAPNGTTTMDLWDNTANASSRLGYTAPTANTTTGTVSTWAQTMTGTGPTLIIDMTAGTASGCSCGGSVCIPTPASTYCSAAFSGVAVPTRLWISASTNATVTGISAQFVPGQWGTSTGSTRFWGVQVESSSRPTPYTGATTTAAVTRNADNITIPIQITPSNTRWCAGGTYTPYMRGWANPEGTINTLWAAGAFDAANSGRLEIGGTKLAYTLVDYLGTPKRLEYDATAITTGSHKVQSCVADGRMALYVDDVLVGAGYTFAAPDWQTIRPGVWLTPPTTVTLGARVNQTNHFDGYVRDFNFKRDTFSSGMIMQLDAALAVWAPFNGVN